MDESQRVEEELLRRLSPAEKIAIMNALIRQARALKEAWVRATHPELSDEAVRAKVAELMGGGRT